GPLVIQRHHPGSDKSAVKTVPRYIGAGRGQYQPDAVDVFPAIQRHGSQTEGSRRGDRSPKYMTQEFHVLTSLLKRWQGGRSRNYFSLRPYCTLMWHDLRFAFRQFRASKAFTITAVVTLALGIGANTGIFTLVHAILLKSLPVADPQRIVRLGD